LRVKLIVNQKSVTVDDASDTPLLWVLRDTVGLTGTKYGCGIGQCGACTVLVDGEPVRSCTLPLSKFEGKRITTIEGIAHGETLSKVQQAWLDIEVPQCGYCQSGMIVATTALLTKHPKPTDAQIDEALTNICRCGTYDRIRVAVKKAAGIA
jgi:isoquinoline 1-oxidoreductase alpha subunit